MLGHIALAMALGGAVGFERELVREPAGLRTHMLICGAAALIAGLGQLLVADFTEQPYRDLLRTDPLRVIEAVVAAVGFVGAGTIIKRPDNQDVQGLTTAASLLMVAGLGIAVGIGHVIVAVGATVLAIGVLTLVRTWERRHIRAK